MSAIHSPCSGKAIPEFKASQEAVLIFQIRVGYGLGKGWTLGKVVEFNQCDGGGAK